jgi:hypothetical protein
VEKLPDGFSYVEGSVMPSDRGEVAGRVLLRGWVGDSDRHNAGGGITANTTTEAAGQDLSFSLVDESSVTYKVMTSASAGPHSFPSGVSKLVYGLDSTEVFTVGDDQVTVMAAPPGGRVALHLQGYDVGLSGDAQLPLRQQAGLRG